MNALAARGWPGAITTTNSSLNSVRVTTRRSSTRSLTTARSSRPSSSASIGALVARDVDSDVDERMRPAILLQHRRQPVVARVAFGRDAQHAPAVPGQLTDRVFRLDDRRQHLVGRREQALARRRQRQPLADPKEQRGAEPRFDVAQLMAERGLREVQREAGTRQRARLGDRANQLQVPDFELHAAHYKFSSF